MSCRIAIMKTLSKWPSTSNGDYQQQKLLGQVLFSLGRQPPLRGEKVGVSGRVNCWPD
jgi:hypothetical protein